MSILGIDYGAKKIGLAISGQQEKMALPFLILSNLSQTEVLSQLKKICQENEVEKIIVGVPVSFTPKKAEGLLRDVDLQNQQMREVLAFVDWLKANFDLPIEVEDERLSTKMANTLMKGKVRGKDDDVAAMLILQSYLDKKLKK